MSKPPIAEKREHLVTAGSSSWPDPYFWMRHREDPAVTAYLEAENAHTDSTLEPTLPLQAGLYREMVARIKEDDSSPPAPNGPWWYYRRTVKDLQYPLYCRKPSLQGQEQVVFDQNSMAGDAAYYALGVLDVSTNHKTLAFAEDTDGSESFHLRFKDIESGKLLPDSIEGVYYSSAWSNDDRFFFYTVLDQNHRPFRVMRHQLGADPAQDTMVFEEADPAFFLSVGKTRSRGFIVITAESQVTTESWVIPAEQPESDPKCIRPREHELEYRVDHYPGYFYAVTNQNAVNFRVVRTPDSLESQEWEEVLPHKLDTKVEDLLMFQNHMVVHLRRRGMTQLDVVDLSSQEAHTVAIEESVYVCSPDENMSFDTSVLRFNLSSPVTPPSIYDYDMSTRKRSLRKQTEVLGGYSPDRYRTERVWAKSKDGQEIPVSVLYSKNLPRDGSSQCLLYGYGSYGISMDPAFSPSRFSLVDRGFVFAIAHIRGGGDMGRPWYEDGKKFKKTNTFEDFIACAQHLIDEKFTSPTKLGVMGGSAGGLLIGAVINQRPDLFGAAVAQVPFVGRREYHAR